MRCYRISKSDDGLTFREYAQFIAGLAGKHVVYDIENNKFASQISYAIMDISKIINFGWQPIYTVKEVLQRTFDILSADSKSSKIKRIKNGTYRTNDIKLHKV